MTVAAAGTEHYFVDEAGDGTLFDARGRVIVGVAGCSNYFILGLLKVPEPLVLGAALSALRSELLADPYFRGVPSMQPEARKTAVAFHAKDDLAEVRREVLQLVSRQNLRFLAIVKDKRAVVEYVRSRNLNDPNYRYHPNELYDFLVRRLFRQQLHKATEYEVVFSRRGARSRTAALRAALEAARDRFCRQHGISARPVVAVRAELSNRCAALQAVDYFLWSLQRTYERGEDRYLNLLWPQIRLVVDVDDTRDRPYGTYYTRQRPLTAAAIRR